MPVQADKPEHSRDRRQWRTPARCQGFGNPSQPGKPRHAAQKLVIFINHKPPKSENHPRRLSPSIHPPAHVPTLAAFLPLQHIYSSSLLLLLLSVHLLLPLHSLLPIYNTLHLLHLYDNIFSSSTPQPSTYFIAQTSSTYDVLFSATLTTHHPVYCYLPIHHQQAELSLHEVQHRHSTAQHRVSCVLKTFQTSIKRNIQNPYKMQATKVLRQAAAHADRVPSIKFIGRRSIPSTSSLSPLA